MTEAEYIRATNRAKLFAAEKIIRDILAGTDYGVSEEDKATLINIIMDQRLMTHYDEIDPE